MDKVIIELLKQRDDAVKRRGEGHSYWGVTLSAEIRRLDQIISSLIIEQYHPATISDEVSLYTNSNQK